MAYGQPSGVTTYDPLASDLVLDALERCDIYAPETRHMTSARRSANLILSSKYSNKGINLWKVDDEPTAFTMNEGVIAYDLTSDVVGMFDTYRRQYQMNAAASSTMDFTTTLNSKTVTVGLTNAGVVVGGYVQVAMQVAVGGIILFGFYAVQSTPTVDSFTISAADAAASSVSHGGVAPIFTTTSGSATISVHLPSHGYAAGEPFQVPVSTTVGGVQIQGVYTITTVTDADNFTFVGPSTATSADTATENGGEAYLATQNLQGQPTDILMTPISRNDYAAQSNKFAPGAPTTYWCSRQRTPVVRVWPAPDSNGPYEMRTYLMRQINVVNPTGGQTLDMPQRFLFPFTCDLATDLSIKFAPKKYAMLKSEAQEAWDDASASDVEHTSSFFVPNFPTV